MEETFVFDGLDTRLVKGSQRKRDLLESLANKSIRPTFHSASPRFFHNKGTCSVSNDSSGEPTLMFLGADNEGFKIRFDSERVLFTSELVGSVSWSQSTGETIDPNQMHGYTLNRSFLLGQKLKFRNTVRTIAAVIAVFLVGTFLLGRLNR